MAATWEDVSAIARELPQAEPGIRVGDPTWKVGKNVFVWVRPLRARDREELGDAAPTGEIVGASTIDVGEKLALIDEDPRAFFTTSHFDDFPAILISLDHVDPERLREVVTDAWIARAPKRLAAEFLTRFE
jgi:Uncharacterized protein conserved in bacteria